MKPDPKARANLRAIKFAIAGGALATLVLTQCTSTEPGATSSSVEDATAGKTSSTSVEAWEVVYRALQHPRCLNCHPAGDAPLQGDQSLPHQQNVQRGPDGHGLYAMRCETCHQGQNLPGEHMPPGAPTWHLPSKAMPLVFEGKSSGELCRQLKDPKRNGGKSMQQILDHIDHDPLVMWGWEPGNGRAPVSVPHAELVKAVRTWIDHDCGCP
jgi:hypothetical protein